MTCDPDSDHLTHAMACARADGEWTRAGIWYQVAFCNCGGWRLIPRD